MTRAFTELLLAMEAVEQCCCFIVSYIPSYYLLLAEVSTLLQTPSQSKPYQARGGSSYCADYHPLGKILLPASKITLR